MEILNKPFLETMKASRESKPFTADNRIDIETWRRKFQLSDVHHVLPMIYESVYQRPSFVAYGPELSFMAKRQTI